MRISSLQFQQRGIDSLLRAQRDVSDTQLRLASGKKILSPSDDPAAAARILTLSQTEAQVQQFQKNIELARARLGTEEEIISSVSDVIQRARELAVQANNASNSAGARADIAQELRQRLDELIGFANQRDGAGEFMFAGYQGKSQPFTLSAGTVTYNGDSGQRFVQIGSSRQVAVGDPGSDLFMAIRNGNGDFVSTANTSNQGTGVIDVGAVIDRAVYTTGGNNTDTYTVVMAAQTSATNSVTFNDVNANDSLTYQFQINGTNIPFTTTGSAPVYGEGDTVSLAQLAADINAQQGTTGVQAYVDSGTLYLANTSPSGQPITITETLGGSSDLTDSVTGLFGSNLTGSNPSSTVAISDQATGYIVLDSASNIEDAGAYQDGVQISFNGLQTGFKGTPDNGDQFTIVQSDNQSIFETLDNLITTLESSSDNAQGGAQVNNNVARILSEFDLAMENFARIRAKVGARLSAIDSQQTANSALELDTKENKSTLQDLDFAKAVSDLNLQLVALQSAQQSFSRIQNLSLFNYL